MGGRRVIATEPAVAGAVSESELDIGITYARDPAGKYRRVLDRDLLRLIVDTVMARREQHSILPFLTATVAREVIPEREKKDALKYEAYQGAAMKIFSARSVRARAARAHSPQSTRSPKAGSPMHPEDTRPKYKGQLILL